jgi:hypothetical protein
MRGAPDGALGAASGAATLQTRKILWDILR